MSDVDAVILVGGQGTRLRPLTVTTPKPMLPAAGVPFVTHLLARLRDSGIEHVVLATSYQSEVFSGHFGDGSSVGLRIDYVTEDVPLGTGGGIRNVAQLLEGRDVVIYNGDVLSGADLGAQIERHRETGADVTLYLTEVPDPRRFGLVPIDEDGRVTAFLEKPKRPEEIVTNLINAGCYVFRREVIDAIPSGRSVSVEHETFPALLDAGRPMVGYVDSRYWLDVGTPEAYVTCSCDLVNGRAPTPVLPSPPGDSLLLEGAQVSSDARVDGGTAIGRGATVDAGAVVTGSVIFDGAVIGQGAQLTSSVVGRGTVIGADCVLDGAVVGDDVHIGARNELRGGIRLWPGLRLPDVAVRFSTDA